MCEELTHHSASANKRRPSPAHAPFLGGSGWIGDGKIRAVVSQGGTSGFGHLLGKDLPLSPTLLPGGEPLTCKWPSVPGNKGPSTPRHHEEPGCSPGGQHHPAHLGLSPQNSPLLPEPP